jgi:hypothetical protein
MTTSFKDAPESKIFCIGFNRTGTRSLIEALELLDLGPVAKPQVLHDKYKERFGEYPYRAICDRVFEHGDYELPLLIAREFRCLKDRPWNIAPMYRLLDEAFPGSRFLFTWRDPAKWWRSVEKWLSRDEEGREAKVLRYLKHLGADSIERTQFINGYSAYNAEVRNYFDGRDDFLELCWEEGDGWGELCAFLGIPMPNLPFPHSNRQMYDQ